MTFFRQFVVYIEYFFYRPEMEDTQSDQAGPDASNSDVVKTNTVNNESMDGEKMESDSEDIYVPVSTARSKHSSTVGKRSITGPRANRGKR